MALCAEICLFALRCSPWPSPALICITIFSYVKLVEGTTERSDCRRKGEKRFPTLLILVNVSGRGCITFTIPVLPENIFFKSPSFH